MFQLDSALFPVYPVAFKHVITKCLSWPLSSARGGNDFIRIDIVAAEMITEELLSRKSQRLRYFSLP